MENVNKFILQDTKFKGQEDSGTALELIETTAQIINSTFTSNLKGKLKIYTPVGFSADYFPHGVHVGGAIIATHSQIGINHSKFENNGADVGGAIFTEQRSIVTVNNSTFVGNWFGRHSDDAFSLGGAIYQIEGTVTMANCHFVYNTASWGGVLYSIHSTVTVEASGFDSNSVTERGGVLCSELSTVTIEASLLVNNKAYILTGEGGVLYSKFSTITIEASVFDNNIAYMTGGVLHSRFSTITIEASIFDNNTAYLDVGGVMDSYFCTIAIEASVFDHNSAKMNGGVLVSSFSTVTIEESVFNSNSAIKLGGVLSSVGSTITIEASEFDNNNATGQGGVLESNNSTVMIADSKFTNNNSSVGAVIYARYNSTIKFNSSLLIANNSAVEYAIVYLYSDCNGHFSGNATFSNNLGSLMAFSTNITFTGSVTFVSNQEPQTVNFQEGGSITLFQSNMLFNGMCNLEYNHAQNGGAVLSVDSKVYVNGNVTVAHNTAARNGGGIHLSNSELNCQRKSTFELLNNTATHKGGGLHAVGSSIKAMSSTMLWSQYTGTKINFVKNTAESGGGLSLEANAKLYIEKRHVTAQYIALTVTLTDNTAHYGGAVYVDDDTNSGTCTSDPKADCFFQVLDLIGYEDNFVTTPNIYFSQNYAKISGSTLYGGLLDRCAVSQFAEVRIKNKSYLGDGSNGVTYFKDVSVTTNTSISSRPVKVCLCIRDEHICSKQNNMTLYIEVMKGKTFTASVVAVDQIGHPVNGTIQTSLKFTESGLAEGQLTREIPAKCTDLTFNVVSPHSTEELTLYASDGPCKDAELSKMTLGIHFLPCSCLIGLQPSGKNKTNCTCECHTDIHQYVEQCDPHTGSFVRQSQSKAWISYINDTQPSGYLVYSNCPFDYCKSPGPSIDLNQLNGANVQCAFNRSSLLCGSCQPDLSLSLSSSCCLLCPSHWPALLVTFTMVALLAGITLVALLLVLNMTVAVGTLNGLIFYANILYANKSILLQFQETNFITVFVSWLNLELGIDTCYFLGMDTYTKTWLQLAFPTYVIFLVVLVIITSSYSSRFSNLIGKKNPVETLATLILLSYAKLLEVSFKTLSVGILEYPDGSSEMLWLPDATVKYLSGKHIPLFIAAVLILLAGLVYTALLFSWQWLLRLPRWRIFKWSRDQKLQTFIETYHTPYTSKHRYWTGFLLLVRAILSLVTAVNVSNDPQISLVAITFTVCCIVLLKGYIGSRVYRKWSVDVLETTFYLNILFFSMFTWYYLSGTESNQKAAAYTSVITTFILLLLIILYHVYTYTYTSAFSMVNKTKPGKIVNRLFTTDPKPKRQSQLRDDDIREFHELIDTIDHPITLSLIRMPAGPTRSVVEIRKPYLPPPQPGEPNSLSAGEALQIEDRQD